MNRHHLHPAATGFLMASCLFLLTGQLSNPPCNPPTAPYRYQLVVTHDNIVMAFDAVTGTTKLVAGVPAAKCWWGTPYEEIPAVPVPTGVR